MSESAERSLVGATPRISLAILAMGGQGGGVLADWIVALAEAEGWRAQSTSVPGVAQRTGATIYYIEIAPPRDGVDPIFALMPTPGDVDIVMAAELMEAGRSVLRGLVTPDRTTLIASTHRALAVVEKQAPGDGVADPEVVTLATDFAARRVIAFDMEAMAKARGSVISATMFGALAGSGQLPFQRSAFEGAIRAGGAGVEASLAAFGAAYEQTGVKPIEAIRHGPEKYFVGWPDHAGNEELDRIGDRIRAFPGVAQPMLATGARKLVDYLDPAYAIEYLDRIGALMELDRACGGEAKGYAFTVTAAKYLATAMAYDDVPRVADLKIRASRQARVRQEVQARAGYDRDDDGIFSSARRRTLRLAAEGAWRMGGSEAGAGVFPADLRRSRSSHPREHDRRLSDAGVRSLARPQAARHATARARDEAHRIVAGSRAARPQGAL